MRLIFFTSVLLVLINLCCCWIQPVTYRTKSRVAGVALFRKLSLNTHFPSQATSQTCLLANSNDRDQQEIQSTALTPEEEAEKVLIERVQREVLAETGAELEDLINPSKVISLERELVALSAELDKTSELQARADIETKMSKKRDVLAVEKRAVMRSWLKNLFVAQSIIALVISAVLVSPFFM